MASRFVGCFPTPTTRSTNPPTYSVSPPQEGHHALAEVGHGGCVCGYGEEQWSPECPGASMPFAPLAALMFLIGDVYNGHRQQDDPASVPLVPRMRGGGGVLNKRMQARPQGCAPAKCLVVPAGKVCLGVVGKFPIIAKCYSWLV